MKSKQSSKWTCEWSLNLEQEEDFFIKQAWQTQTPSFPSSAGKVLLAYFLSDSCWNLTHCKIIFLNIILFIFGCAGSLLLLRLSLVAASMLSRFSRVWLSATTRTIAHQLLCPWDFPGKNTGVGYHSLLQRIFLTQGSNLCPLHCRQIFFFFFLGKKWIYLERNTLHRQGVGHPSQRASVALGETLHRVWAVATTKPGNTTTEPVLWSLRSSNYWAHNPQLLKPTCPRAELHKRSHHYEKPVHCN